ncbi:hypothetical protein DH2020_017164 [Rehmannia glutinosa]|uniref:EF-hand domain-containing protein n=1 Tax=Rehmannia glutinosa TaxID=99300 RepID=A0ABR0WTK8_REHGL
MAKSDTEDPLLEQPLDSSHYSNQNNALKKRRNSRCKSLPEQISHPEQNRIASLEKLDYKLALLVLSAYVGVGALSFFLVRHQIKGSKTNGIIDAVYFCIVTMTTVGYGDLVPDSTISKFLACVFVFIGMALVGLLLSKAADNIVENQEIFLKEGLGLFDAFYCVCATITTLGYGDESFSTSGGRLFAVFWILISTICLAQFFYSLAELYTERRRKSLVNWVLSRKLTVSDLEAADLDNDKVMGKINDEDIAMVMEWFKHLDVDQSGTLTKADLVNYGSSNT